MAGIEAFSIITELTRLNRLCAVKSYTNMKASVVVLGESPSHRAAKAPVPNFEDFEYSPSSLEAKSTASTANGRPSVNPEDEQDTDESVEARAVRGCVFRPSERSQRGRVSLHKKSFKQELEKLGSKANQILDKNPNKLGTSRGPSPDREPDEKLLLPFQRRARSNSPIRDELDLTKKTPVNLFPFQGPVKANKPVGKKTATVDAFSGIVDEDEHSPVPNEDDELEVLKLEYSRLLDQTAGATVREDPKVDDPPKPTKARRSKITFL